MDGKKYRDNFKAYFGDIRGTSNEVSRKHGLSVIAPEGSGKSYAEWDANRKGKATIRGLIRQDIDAIIDQSFTYATFLAVLRKHGYEIKSGTNVAHTAVKPPGGTRFVRLDSLGDGYTEEEIKQRLSSARTGSAPKMQAQTQGTQPKRYTFRRGNVPRKRKKLRGFRALYVHYLFFLGIQKPGPKQKYIPFPVRKEVTKLHRYQRQFRLLQEYRIETDTQLFMLKDALQADIDALTDQRKGLYKEKRNGEDVTARLDAVNVGLRELRAKLKTCGQIEVDISLVREQVQMIHEQEKKSQKKEKQKQQKPERRFNRWM